MTSLDGQLHQHAGLQDRRPSAQQTSLASIHHNAPSSGQRLQPPGLTGYLGQQRAAPEANRMPFANVPRGMFDAFLNTCQRWRLEQGGQLRLLGYGEHDFLGSQLLLGHMPARTQDIKDRIGYVLAISLGLGTIFNEAIAPELLWLSTVHARLDAPPLEFMLRGRMIHLIGVADIVRYERGL